MIVRFEPRVESVLREIGQAAAAANAEAWAVGGAVRDALVGSSVQDVDVSIVGPVRAVVRRLAGPWNAEIEQHDAFSTATLVRQDGLRVDFVRARSEVYETPGALPSVTPSCLADDLSRRDFTVNAIAADLSDERFGEIVDPCGGVEDCSGGVLRTMHPASFLDDPTRLFRAARYCVRLGLAPDDETDGAARRAVASGALNTISADRRWRETGLLLAESQWAGAVAWLNAWGVWSALAGGWQASATLLKRMDVVCAWARRCQGEPVPAEEEIRFVFLLAAGPAPILDSLAAKPAVRRIVGSVHRVLGSLLEAETPAWWRAMDAVPLTVLLPSLALCRNDAEKHRLSQYIERIRSIRLSIGGDDIVAAGIAAPTRGTLDALRTGHLAGRDEQLAYALDFVRQRSR
jgi:tRNA nucleotidyltransferase (CCA-adding enzyme)